MSYVSSWTRISREAERDLAPLRGDPTSAPGVAAWRRFRERLERTDRTNEPEIGIYAEMMGMVTHFFRSSPGARTRRSSSGTSRA